MGEPKKITELWAWVVTEPDGGEGVPAMSHQGLMLPMMGADEDRIRSLAPMAKAIADSKALPLKLLRFTGMQVVEVHRG